MTKAIAKRKRSASAKRRRKALARVSALSAFFGSALSMGVLAVILLAAGSLHVPFWGAIMFCLTVSTLGGYWFGTQGGRFLKEEDDDD